jgi:hypothetical protein
MLWSIAGEFGLRGTDWPIRSLKMESHMRRFSWMIAVLSLAGFVMGCGGAQDTADHTESATEQWTQTPSQGSAAQTDIASLATLQRLSPSQVAAQFYEALRRGDRDAVEALLTDKTRQETAKNGLEIRPQASTTLTYEIGETDYVTEEMDGAHVGSLWTETDEHGQSMTSTVIWVLRKQANGWRIAGMATPVIEGELPLFFDFEDPENMLRTKDYVDTEVYGKQGEQAEMAQQPTHPNESASTNTEVR